MAEQIIHRVAGCNPTNKDAIALINSDTKHHTDTLFNAGFDFWTFDEFFNMVNDNEFDVSDWYLKDIFIYSD